MAEQNNKEISSSEKMKVVNDFYKTLEQGYIVYDKYYKEENPFIENTTKDSSEEDRIENFNEVGTYGKDPFVDYTAQFNKQNNTKLIKDYLVGERKLSSQIVDTMIDQDLIRGVTNGNYNYIEFAWKKPNSLEESNQFSNKDQEVVGSDRMNFVKNDEGKYVRNSREQGGQTIAKNSESNYGFNVKTGTGKDNLFVFEAPVDALSYATLNGKQLAGTNSTLLSLSGVSKSKAIQGFVHKQFAQNSDFKNIVLCVDNDHAGKKMIGDFTKNIDDKNHFVNHANEYRHHIYVKHSNVGKDWNDGLKATRNFINNNNDNDAELESKLTKKTRYDINDYIFQQTKNVVYGNDFPHVINEHVTALNNLYKGFENNHNINLKGKDYKMYQTSSNNLSDDFKNYMSEFGQNMKPDELYKYVQKAMKNEQITPNEKQNIKEAQKLKQSNDKTGLSNFVSHEVLDGHLSSDALDKYQKIMLKASNKNTNNQIKGEKVANKMKAPNRHPNNSNEEEINSKIANFDLNNNNKLKHVITAKNNKQNSNNQSSQNNSHSNNQSSQNNSQRDFIQHAVNVEKGLNTGHITVSDITGKKQQTKTHRDKIKASKAKDRQREMDLANQRQHQHNGFNMR